MEKIKTTNSNDDSYFWFYHMMYSSLKTDNVFEGFNKTLFLLKMYLRSGDIVLHRKDNDGTYKCFKSQSLMNNSLEQIGCIVNKTSKLVETKQSYFIDLNLSEQLKNVMMLHIDAYNHEYILSISNVNKEKFLNDEFLKRLMDTMKVILKRADMHEKNVIAINEDALTGLNNRTSYESRILNFKSLDDNLIYGIFDLFRLKYINDNYSHSLGDKYIVEVAKILSKYWPEERSTRKFNDSSINVKTGHSLYRIGGDEFVLMTDTEQLDLTRLKAKLAKEESEMIDLGIGENVPIGINFGIVKHNPEHTIKQTYIEADQIMQEDKRNMYLKYSLDRRR